MHSLNEKIDYTSFSEKLLTHSEKLIEFWNGEKSLREGIKIYRGLRMSYDDSCKKGWDKIIKSYIVGQPSFWAEDMNAAIQYANTDLSIDGPQVSFLVEAEVVKCDNCFAEYNMCRFFLKMVKERVIPIQVHVHDVQKEFSVKLAEKFKNKNYSGVLSGMNDILISDHSILRVNRIFKLQRCVKNGVNVDFLNANQKSIVDIDFS